MAEKGVQGKRLKQTNATHTAGVIVATICVVILLVLILAIVGWYNPFVINPDPIKPSPSKPATPVCRDVQVPYEIQEEYIKTEYYPETVPYTDRVCETKDILYSATNNKWDYITCNKIDKKCSGTNWLGMPNDCVDFCSDKSLSYSVDINNLDEEQGSWTVNINVYKQGTIYKTIPITQFLYPKTTKTFTGAFKIAGDSPTGDSNQAYTASYNLQYVPTKQVCRDVTKYEEVQRERQVTAYRPVTKYRIERQCN